MDSRRSSRAVIDPKVRQVGFLSNAPPPPDRSQSDPLPSPRRLTIPNSLSSVMIPPLRHPSNSLLSRRSPSPSVESDFFPPPSPTITASFGDFSDEVGASPPARGINGRGSSGKPLGTSSFPV